MNKIIATIGLSLMAVAVNVTPLEAAAPVGYYSSCDGGRGRALLTSLSEVIGSHSDVGYGGLWDLYKTSDTRADGTIWDMYSTYRFTYKNDQCGSYSVLGDCYNREHSMPKSWFNDASPMYSDAFHIYPTDGKVNGQRSNYPYGECANGTSVAPSKGAKALGRLGQSTFPGYSGIVFEPDDQYKGDFARTYFYMATCYNSRISTWKSDMLAGNSYPAFTDWALQLLLKWHRQDPVSDKETARNDAVYARQHNRNPFIDHPELVEYIWGDKQGDTWHENADAEPQIALPADGTSIDLGATVVGYARTATVAIRGINLPAAVSVAVSGDGFSANASTISAASANSGSEIVVTFKPERVGEFAGKLILTCGGLSSTVNLVGKAADHLPAGPVNALSDNSFVATWSFIGDADSRGEYTLDVRCGGVSLDAYPTSVAAADEAFLVEDLDPSTTYTYTVASRHLVSDEVSVTTLAPVPAIYFLFDGELKFTAKTGEPSDVAEILVDAINIDNDIVLTVSEPFQLSTDKAAWATTITLDSEEDRFYLRLFGSKAGQYHSSLTARSGDYLNDDVEFLGTVADAVGFLEDFEAEENQSYNDAQFQGSACLWNATNAGIWSSDTSHGGDMAVRMGKNSNSCIEMAEDFSAGFGTVTLWAARWNNKGDGDATFLLEYSTDGGSTWQSAGEATASDTEYTQFTFTVNVGTPARLRVRQTAGARFLVDDIASAGYSGLVPESVADHHRWDAYCRDGRLIVEAAEEVAVSVYALDGTTVYAGKVAAGNTAIDAPAGLYVVTVDNFARRVLVK